MNHPGHAGLATVDTSDEDRSDALVEMPALSSHFARLGEAFSTATATTPLLNPYPIAISDEVALALGLEPSRLRDPAYTAAFAGNRLFKGSSPIAAVYSGHQFGVWAGQLGDGRALLLGGLDTPSGWQELQLKGAGPTPYSRRADGRAVLRSSIREFLCSEAMAALGIATTRALALVGSPLPVLRETVETAAIVTRVAPSFVRFGSFEHWAAKRDEVHLRELADYVIDESYPHLKADGAPYLALLCEVIARSACLVAKWQAVGFCHGVLNTDNMSILGLTLDYGPFGFMEAYDQGFICNHSDHLGRYAYAAQPKIVHWNLYALGQALLPLIGSVEKAQDALESFGAQYESAFLAEMRAKLGLAGIRDDDQVLFNDLFALMQANHPDFTQFYRQLSSICKFDDRADAAITDLMADREATRTWLTRYRERLGQEERSDEERKLAMDRINPKYVLRNYLAELAIQAAQQNDFAMIERLLTVLRRPYDEHPAHHELSALPPDWASGLEVSCSS